MGGSSSTKFPYESTVCPKKERERERAKKATLSYKKVIKNTYNADTPNKKIEQKQKKRQDYGGISLQLHLSKLRKSLLLSLLVLSLSLLSLTLSLSALTLCSFSRSLLSLSRSLARSLLSPALLVKTKWFVSRTESMLEAETSSLRKLM